MSAAILTAVFAAAGAGDWATVESHMSDDLVIHEPPSLPFGGDWCGRDALQRLFAHVMGYWDDPQVTIERVVGDDDWAVGILTFAMTSKQTGRRFTQRMAEVSRFEGGKVVETHIHYFDTAEVAREAGPRR